jgi:hypothetical protein
MLFLEKSVKMTEDVRQKHSLPYSLFYPQVKAIEEHIDLGQIEEVIEMVKDEIKLSELYIGHPLIATFCISLDCRGKRLGTR